MSAAEPSHVPLPVGFGVTFDPGVRFFHGGTVLWGGHPSRVLKLTTAGRRALTALTRGTVTDRATGLLARRLVDAGLAHPRPPAARPSVTVVIPVREQHDDLARCLASVGTAHPVIVVDDASPDPAPIASACARFGARVVRRAVPGGPAAARNTALPGVDTELVAFVDSDCIVAPTWLAELAGHFADHMVTACAPRVVGCSRHDVDGDLVPSPLDMGPHAAVVAPMGRVSYLPTAALLVRRAALGGGFDEQLRYGEDVDLVWRLIDAGGRVLYDPTVRVRHAEPESRRTALVRRFRYGTSAAPLSRRHPGRLAPLVLHPATAVAVGLALLGRPAAATLAGAVTTGWVAARLSKHGVPWRFGLRVGGRAVQQSFLGTARAGVQLYLPLLLALATLPRRQQRAAALGLLLAGSVPPREATDRLAYGLGVWRGCAREHTFAPVRPLVTRGHPGATP
ncbi:MAG: mycofactocin system glycosyltransferase [Streptosporangiales bacterium]|nr:mycofactocin system glycosyltransferase [Streptosporangiales bacterium]